MEKEKKNNSCSIVKRIIVRTIRMEITIIATFCVPCKILTLNLSISLHQPQLFCLRVLPRRWETIYCNGGVIRMLQISLNDAPLQTAKTKGTIQCTNQLELYALSWHKYLRRGLVLHPTHIHMKNKTPRKWQRNAGKRQAEGTQQKTTAHLHVATNWNMDMTKKWRNTHPCIHS